MESVNWQILYIFTAQYGMRSLSKFISNWMSKSASPVHADEQSAYAIEQDLYFTP